MGMAGIIKIFIKNPLRIIKNPFRENFINPQKDFQIQTLESSTDCHYLYEF